MKCYKNKGPYKTTQIAGADLKDLKVKNCGNRFDVFVSCLDKICFQKSVQDELFDPELSQFKTIIFCLFCCLSDLHLTSKTKIQIWILGWADSKTSLQQKTK